MKIIDQFLQEVKQSYLIYCDMDEVICDWDKAFHNLGYGTADKFIKKYGKDSIWKIIAKQGIKFWSEMEWMPDGRELWSFIKSHHPTILSAPTKSPSSKVGKKLWVKKNLGSNVKLILEPSKTKKLHAKPNAILIDDREDNIKDWKIAGGIGIQHKSTKDTIEKLKEILND